MPRKKWSYRYKKGMKPNNVTYEWIDCTAKDKEKIERMIGHKVEFRENKPPEPTPSMKE
jgi:hypothetical protein